MADGVTVALQQATAALLSTDGRLAQLVVFEYATIDALSRRVEDQVGELLARQSPVAGDLRLAITHCTWPATWNGWVTWPCTWRNRAVASSAGRGDTAVV